MNMFRGPMQSYPGLEQWGNQVQLPSSKINLYLYDTGGDSKPPVLLLHGLGDEADTWRHVLPLIKDDFRAIAPDLPGFGRSEKGKRSYTIPFFAGRMLELLDLFSIGKTILVGHSAGAMIAQKIAMETPKRVKKLVLISGSLVSQNNRFDPGLLLFMIPGIGEWLYSRLRKDPQAAFRTLEPYYNHLDELPQSDRDFLYRRVNERVWSNGQRLGFLSTLRSLATWLPSQQKSLADQLKGWDIPTTIIWGEKDRISQIENAQALIGMIPSARLVAVPEAGHNVQQEKAEIVANAIKTTD